MAHLGGRREAHKERGGGEARERGGKEQERDVDEQEQPLVGGAHGGRQDGERAFGPLHGF